MSDSIQPLATTETQQHATRPSAVRWHIVLLLMGLSFFSYFNRISMSVAGTERLIAKPEAQPPGDGGTKATDGGADRRIERHRLDPTWMGTVYTAFLIAYTLGMTPGGWLIDRVGPRLALAVMGFGSAAFVALTGLAALGPTAVAMLV